MFDRFVVGLVVSLAAQVVATSAGAATRKVEVGDFFFRPSALTIAAGDTILWESIVGNDHDTTSGIPPTGLLWEAELATLGSTFSFTFTNTGFYPYGCARHTQFNQTGAVSVVTGPLIPPTVTVTSPPDGTFLTTPASFTLAATAADSDGTIASVQFFRGTTLIGTDTNAPYSTNVNNLAAGTYVLTAVARDNLGLTATSAPVTVTILGGGSATVNITNSAFVPAIVNVAAGSSVIWSNRDAFAHTTVGVAESMEVLCGPGVLLSTSRGCTNRFWTPGIYPYYCTIHPSMVGTVIVHRVNSSPLVSLSAPAPGDTFVTNSLVTLVAVPTDSRPITNVQFFSGVVSLGSLTSMPYSLTLSNLAAGIYSVTAKVRNNVGLGALSDPVIFSVIAPASIQLLEPAFGLGGLFQFNHTADPGLTYVVEGSRDAGAVAPFDALHTNRAATNIITFTDPAPRPDRAYRVRLVP